MKEIKTIALVDWNWAGHHPTYINQFILALEELGVNVLALCPNPIEAAETADKTRKNQPSENLQRGWTEYGTVEWTPRRFPRFLRGRMGAIDTAIRHFSGIERQALEWGRKTGRNVDGIFYACMYDWDFEWVHYAQPFLRIPWQGLYLHATGYRRPATPHPYTRRVPCPKQMFGGKLCRGIAILDEGILERVSASIGKPVVVMPDLTDERLAANGNEPLLAGRLKQFAALPVAGLFGHLKKSKGVLTFVEAAKMSNASETRFALGGQMDRPTEPREAGLIQQCLGENSNVWSHLARIPNETILNNLMSACDVLLAAYIDFPHSSNIMTKAALLNKPLIVSDGYLMAENVRRFNTGEVIPQGNAQALLEAILKITKDPRAWVANAKPRWADYCKEHSFENLKASLSKLLALF